MASLAVNLGLIEPACGMANGGTCTCGDEVMISGVIPCNHANLSITHTQCACKMCNVHNPLESDTQWTLDALAVNLGLVEQECGMRNGGTCTCGDEVMTNRTVPCVRMEICKHHAYTVRVQYLRGAQPVDA